MEKENLLNKLYYSLLTMVTYLAFFWFAKEIFGFEQKVASQVFWLMNYGICCLVFHVFQERILWIIGSVYIGIMIIVTYYATKSMTTILMIGVTFLLYLIIFRCMKYSLVRVLVGMAGIVTLLAVFFTFGDCDKILIALVAFLLLNSISELLVLGKISKCNNRMLSVIYIIASTLLVFTPTKEEPYGWDFVFRIAEYVRDTAIDIYDSFEKRAVFDFGRNGLNYIGYSENIDVWEGNLKDNYSKVFIVDGNNKKGYLYLGGNVMDSFDGVRWSSEEEEVSYSEDNQLWMLLYACFYLGADMDEFIKVRDITVTYENIRTNSIFLPRKILELPEDLTRVGDNPRLNKARRQGFSYSCRYMDVDYENAGMQKVLLHSEEIKYDRKIWEEMVDYCRKEYKIQPNMNFEAFYNTMKVDEKSIRKRYLKEDYYLSRKVRDLVDSLVTQDDREILKCLKLQEYFSTIDYSTEIRVPRGKDIVEWFLCESKQGYCAHYATALACMLKNQNIPARVVEGFVINNGEKNKSTVLQQQAHVWVEAYITGIGWVLMDPTNQYPGWELLKDPAFLENESTKVEDETIISQSGEEVEEEILRSEETDNLEDDSSDEGDLDDNNSEEENSEDLFERLKLYSIIAAITLASIILMILGNIAIKRYRINHSNNPEVLMKEILRLFGKKYGVRKESETIAEYIGRLELPEEQGDVMKNIIVEEMQGLWYGNQAVSETTITQMKQMIQTENNSHGLWPVGK
ncbi:MAG: transglutaminase domain-containing protein [Lachnospiraceae bacterium]